MIKITIIGCGNLGQSIALGLCACKGFDKGSLTLTKRNLDSLSSFKNQGVVVTNDNRKAVLEADIILLALKPYNLSGVINEISDLLRPEQKVVSLAANLSLKDIVEILPKGVKVYRAMPNIASTINDGLTAISADFSLDENNDEVIELFKKIGEVIIVDEDLMGSVTVLGACGIAFVMRFMRAMEQGGIQIGFDAKTAAKIVQHTVKGAASLLIENGSHPEQEIDKVTTPKGCTIVGLNQMEHAGFSSALIRGIVESYNSLSDIKK